MIIPTKLTERGFFDSTKNNTGKGIRYLFIPLVKEGGRLVYDTATGVTWQQSGSEDYMVYADAQKYVEKLNRERFAGFSDWRLPTLEEAMSLMVPKRSSDGLYIDPMFDKTQRWIWTMDTYKAGDFSRLWRVASFDIGHCYCIYHSSYVRVVR